MLILLLTATDTPSSPSPSATSATPTSAASATIPLPTQAEMQQQNRVAFDEFSDRIADIIMQCSCENEVSAAFANLPNRADNKQAINSFEEAVSSAMLSLREKMREELSKLEKKLQEKGDLPPNP